jgi:predicted ATPase
MSPSVFIALCGLVKDAMQDESDAAPLLRRAALELAAAAAQLENIPDDVVERIENLADPAADKAQTAA